MQGKQVISNRILFDKEKMRVTFLITYIPLLL